MTGIVGKSCLMKRLGIDLPQELFVSASNIELAEPIGQGSLENIVDLFFILIDA